MTKLFACFALFCLIGSAIGAVGTDCPDNELFGALGITKSPKEVTGEGLKYCKSLQAGTSCCVSSEIDKFQTKIEAVVEDFTDAVILRDTALVTLRDTTIPALEAKLATLETNAAAALTRINADIAADAAAGGDDEADATPLTDDQALEVVTSLDAIAKSANDDLADIKSDFTDYQKARGTCMVELLNLQAAAYCLTCDPAATLSKGVAADGTIAIADAVCTRVKGSCFEYVTASATQSAILAIGTITEVIDELNTALAALGDADDDTGYQKLANAVAANAENEPEDETLAENVDQPSAAPAECTTAAACEWICDELFFEGQLVPLPIILGGEQVDTLAFTPTGPLIGDLRRLQGAGSWAPAADEAGVTIEWENDPAELNSEDETVTPAGAGIIKSGFVCVIALLSLFFL